MNKRLTIFSLFAVTLCSGDALLAQDHPTLDASGFQPNRDYFSPVPFEHVDTLSGSLVLRFTDLVLSGNAGRAAQGHYGSVSYAYDVHGNRITAGGTVYAYQPGTLRLIQQGDRTFAYDDTGNLRSEPGLSYTYTPFNMLDTVSGNVSRSYAYDGDHWRMKQTDPDGTTVFVRGPNNELLTEWRNRDGANETMRDYIYVGNRMLLAVEGRR